MVEEAGMTSGQASDEIHPAAAHRPDGAPSSRVYASIGGAYFCAAVLANSLNAQVGGVASFWLAGAIVLAALIRCRVESWVWIVGWAAVADLAASMTMGATLTKSVGLALIDVIEPLLVALVLRRYWDGRPWYLSMRWIALFCTSSIMASLVTGTLGSLWLDIIGTASFSSLWRPWIISDALGFFVVTPFILCWSDRSLRERISRLRAIEFAGLTSVLLVISGLVFTGTFPFLFVLFPILVLLALRGGLQGANTGVVVVGVIGTWFTLAGTGPISVLARSAADQILILQLYLFTAVVSTLSVALIMTQRRRLADGLSHQSLISRAALDNMAQGLSMFDEQRRLVTCNRRYSDLYRLPPELCVPGTPLRSILNYHSQEGIYAGTAEEYLDALQLSGGSALFSEMTFSGGQIVETKRRHLDGGGWVSTHEDVTEQRLSNERILYLASHDTLTGIYSRSYFEDRLQEALASTHNGEIFALHSIDLDRFKEVNDTLGHSVGDDILRQVAGRLRVLVDDRDVVARVGGDEFSILQLGVRDAGAAVALAERILKSLRTPFESSGHPIVIASTIGIALSTAGGSTADDIMKKCDLALYRAKEEGRDRYRLFERGMDAELQARWQLERELTRALSNGEFHLVYQPILDLKSNRIAAFEALARWDHPDRGLVAPVEFISLAEEKGMIISIGEWVLREACREAAKWPEDVRIAVNLSPVQFKAGGLVDAVAAALVASGLSPHRLELEVTESVLLLESQSVLRTFNRLRSLGVRLAMDDFGTGYSSLGYLRKFPFDKIKIDQSFIADIGKNDCLAIVQATVALATKLGISTTAEGVETVAQLATVRLEGCSEAQGYHISRPLAALAATEFLVEHDRVPRFRGEEFGSERQRTGVSHPKRRAAAPLA